MHLLMYAMVLYVQAVGLWAEALQAAVWPLQLSVFYGVTFFLYAWFQVCPDQTWQRFSEMSAVED